jgi:hypothetical protein
MFHHHRLQTLQPYYHTDKALAQPVPYIGIIYARLQKDRTAV